MDDQLEVHVFDEAAAEAYSANSAFVKTAIRVDPPQPDDITRIATRFGEQSFEGSFFLVAEGDSSYGIAIDEFEATHESIGSSQYKKRGTVRAYSLRESCLVETWIGSHLEATTNAVPGDWVVQQPSGELVVMPEDEFRQRYG